MKRFFKVFFLFIGVLVLLTIIAAVAFSVAVYDTTDHTLPAVREANADPETLIHREAVKALTAAEESDELSLLLDETAMNELLFAITQSVDLPMADLQGAYAAYGEDGSLSVELPVRVAGMIPTCLKGTLRVTYVDRVLTLTILRASVGKLSCTSGLVRLLLLNRMTEDALTQAMTDAGISASLDLSSLTLVMTAGQICSTVSALTCDDPNTALYALLADICLDSPELLRFSFGEDRLYGVTVSLDRLAYDPATDGEIPYPVDLDAAAEQTRAMLDRGVTRENVSTVFRYFASGYRTLTDEEKAVADGLGLHENGAGVRSFPASSMVDVMADQSYGLAASILNRAVTLTVTERQINTVLAGLDIIGTGTAFCHDGNVAYIALESIRMGLDDRELRVSVVLRLGQKRLCGYVRTTCPDSTDLKVTAQIDDLRLGRENMNAERLSLFLQYLNSALAGENWICADASASTLTLDFATVLNETDAYAPLLSSRYSLTVQCRRIASQGQLELVFRIFG